MAILMISKRDKYEDLIYLYFTIIGHRSTFSKKVFRVDTAVIYTGT